VKSQQVWGAALLVGGFALGWGVHPKAASQPSSDLARPVSASASAPTSPSASAPPSASVAAPGEPKFSSSQKQEAFESIYKNADWGTNDGGAGNSGLGSRVETTLLYRTFLVQFMKNNEIHSVVDAGCGDWEFSKTIDWKGIDYRGYDIVAPVIESNKRLYGKPNVQFFHADIVEHDLPKADLLVVKNVLQHLPNADVKKFLAVQVPKFKHVLLMNGVNHTTLTGANDDILPGGFRNLDPTAPPFGASGFKALTYYDGFHMQQVLYMGGKNLKKDDSR